MQKFQTMKKLDVFVLFSSITIFPIAAYAEAPYMAWRWRSRDLSSADV